MKTKSLVCPDNQNEICNLISIVQIKERLSRYEIRIVPRKISHQYSPICMSAYTSIRCGSALILSSSHGWLVPSPTSRIIQTLHIQVSCVPSH